MKNMKILEQVKTQSGNTVDLFCKDAKNRNTQEATILIAGCFHGDEPSGKYLIEKYLEKDIEPDNRLLFIPCLNPDGLIAGTRGNAAEVDLNRNFPAKNWEASAKDKYYGGKAPASEAETKFMVAVIEKYCPDLILTLHEPYCIVNYDGPAFDAAKKISEITGYRLEQSIGYPTPGSFGTYCGIERNIPVITLELPPTTESEDAQTPVVSAESLYEPFAKIMDFLNFYNIKN